MTSVHHPGVRIEPATGAHEAAAVAVLVAAFSEDPTIIALLPREARDRRVRLALMFRAEMHTCGLEHVDVALADDDEVVGVAVWGAPERELRRSTAIRWAAVSARALGLHGLWVGHRYDRALDRLRPSTPHWHLLDIATAAAARGQGVGSALLTHRLKALDQAGHAALLEATSDASRRLYASHGFEVVGRLPRAVGGPHVMVRPPSS